MTALYLIGYLIIVILYWITLIKIIDKFRCYLLNDPYWGGAGFVCHILFFPLAILFDIGMIYEGFDFNKKIINLFKKEE